MKNPLPYGIIDERILLGGEIMDDDKKPKKSEDEELKEAEEELEKIIKDVEDQLGVDRSNFKIVKMKVAKKTLFTTIRDGISSSLLNVILMLSISGYLIWAKTDSILDILYFALIFSGFEILIQFLLQKLAIKWIYTTFGLALMLPALISIAMTAKLSTFLEITSVWRLLFMFTILMTMRAILKSIFNRRINV